MVNINEQFPSKYIKSSDLGGQMVKVQIDNIRSEEIGGSGKMVMYFTGKDKGMVLNKTNAQTLADAFGDETDNWIGANIEIFSMKVQYEGRMVDGLRVRIPVPPPNKAAAGRQGNVGFAPNARDRANTGMREMPPPAEPIGRGDSILDDDIPFSAEFR